MKARDLIFNGVDGATGEYLLPPMAPPRVAAIARGEPLEAGPGTALTSWLRRKTQPHLGPVEDADPRDLSQTGWGVVFAQPTDPAVREALAELLAHRRRQATRIRERYFREFAGESGYLAGESKLDFLSRHGAGPGPADPENVPYYLLLVGGPEQIPYRFQHQLDIQYAVGRIDFDSPRDYARYARSVVRAETEGAPTPREIALFGVRNEDDPTTGFTVDHLLRPLAARLSRDRPRWRLRAVLEERASKERLASLLGGEERPAVLVTASHGMGFPADDPRQLRHQGALLCREWPGPRAWRGPIPEEHYFSADDLGDRRSLAGLVSFHYACFGGGTDRRDDFTWRPAGGRARVAPRAFVSSLAKRQLAHPRAGALAVVGHVGRAWGFSYVWPGAGEQSQVFEGALKRLLDGYPVGSAMEPFHLRYAELASDLAAELEEIDFGRRPDEDLLANLWTARNDARNYLVVGDPAARVAS